MIRTLLAILILAVSAMAQTMGVPGQPKPIKAEQVAGTDGINLRALRLDSSGALYVQLPHADAISNAATSFPVNSTGSVANPIAVFPSVFNGATWDRSFYCPNTATFSVASTTTQVVALSGSTKIRICSASLNPSTATVGSVDIVYGTGTNCATGTTTLTGAFTLPASAVVSIPLPLTAQGPLITPAAQAVCVRTVTATVAGFFTWAQY